MPISYAASAIIFGAWLAIGVPVSASANVITDWDEKAVAVVMPAGPVGVSQQVYTAQRMMGMVHAAMFDAVNSIERRYQPVSSAAARGAGDVQGSRCCGGCRSRTGDN